MQDYTMDSKSVIETLNKHVSIREFSNKHIPDDMLNTILNSARRSPTSSNLQTYSFVVVRNPETKKELAKLAGNQKHVETCNVFVAICADISRLSTACEFNNQTLGKSLENTLVATVDASLAGMSLCTAAESLGLGTVMIGGMRNYPKKVAELLNFPQGVYVVYGMCIGWPDWENVKNQKPRFEEDIIIHREKYEQKNVLSKLKDYDKALSDHYKAEGRNINDDAWTGIVASRFNQKRRPELRNTLEGMGFSFD
jgi:nitroreductase